MIRWGSVIIVNQSAVWGPSIVYHGGGGGLDGLRGFQGERSPPPLILCRQQSIKEGTIENWLPINVINCQWVGIIRIL